MATESGNRIPTVYPWRRDGLCTLLIDPAGFIPAILKSIEAAQHYVLLEMYLVESGLTTTKTIDALLAAAERGAQIYIIFDGMGSRRLSQADRNRLRHPRIELTYYHPTRLMQLRYLLVRDHRKLIIVDGRIGYTGGIGLSDGIDTGGGMLQPWHDAVVKFEGSVVADFQALFVSVWAAITNIELCLAGSPTQSADGGNVRLVSSRPAMLNPIYGHLRQRAGIASERLWIATAYFLPSWRLRRALRGAAERGVDVRLLLPGPITDHPAVRSASHRFYAGLLESGVRIFELQPTFQHAKTSLADSWVSIGSSNFDRWSMARNLELNLEVEQPEFAAEVAAMFEHDFDNSTEIDAKKWSQRPLTQHWKETIWGKIESWLDR